MKTYSIHIIKSSLKVNIDAEEIRFACGGHVCVQIGTK
jgi:hypothetical protein